MKRVTSAYVLPHIVEEGVGSIPSLDIMSDVFVKSVRLSLSFGLKRNIAIWSSFLNMLDFKNISR